MQDNNILKDMFKQDALIPLTKDSYGNYSLKLTEPQCSTSSAVIQRVPEDSIVLKVDMFPAPKSIFQGNRGECKRADFAVIVPSKQRILFIEMKISGAPFSYIKKQLRGALCCMEYCKHIVENFWEEKNFLESYELRFIFLGGTSPERRKTNLQKKAQKHDTPDKFMIIKNPNRLFFNQIAI